MLAADPGRPSKSLRSGGLDVMVRRGGDTMFRRDTFVLIAAALVGSVMAVYASLGETPFFPATLQTTLGECPENGDIPAHRRPALDPDEASWFGHSLLALHEAPLVERRAGQRTTLRLTLPDSYPVAVRVTEVEGGRLHLTGKWLQGSSDCTDERGCVVEKLLSPAEQARLEAAVAPLLRVPSYGCYGHVDSSGFILEASDGDGYRMWHQRSPRSGDLLAASVVFVELAEWPGANELALTANRPLQMFEPPAPGRSLNTRPTPETAPPPPGTGSAGRS